MNGNVGRVNGRVGRVNGKVGRGSESFPVSMSKISIFTTTKTCYLLVQSPEINFYSLNLPKLPFPAGKAVDCRNRDPSKKNTKYLIVIILDSCNTVFMSVFIFCQMYTQTFWLLLSVFIFFKNKEK